ncbi:unnamed protein product [Rotaria sordida]|uniref:Mos1 transposase HTH domain-containing protein n=1 Tax=Rotaria sordida TaxID=392033 RepID=A0A814RS22_9BILA|nr:unnamed protein product [Rotaria sordida]
MYKEKCRFYIKVRTGLNIEAITIHDELSTVFGDEVSFFRTVTRWPQWIHEDQQEIEDEERPDRSVNEITAENIEQVDSIINNHSHVTIEELQEQTALSYSTVHRILFYHFKLRKFTARYIPK